MKVKYIKIKTKKVRDKGKKKKIKTKRQIEKEMNKNRQGKCQPKRQRKQRDRKRVPTKRQIFISAEFFFKAQKIENVTQKLSPRSSIRPSDIPFITYLHIFRLLLGFKFVTLFCFGQISFLPNFNFYLSSSNQSKIISNF